MITESPAPPISKAARWTGRIISGLIVLFMGVGGIPALINPAGMQEGFAKDGYHAEQLRPIVIVEILCAILYAIPQTSVLGAILLTGYLGGATATHVRVGEVGIAAVPILMGCLVWLGLFLRDRRVRTLIPFRKCQR